MRRENIEAIARVISAPPEECTPVIVRGIDQFGNEITEELLLPADRSIVTTNNVFYGPTENEKPNDAANRMAATPKQQRAQQRAQQMSEQQNQPETAGGQSEFSGLVSGWVSVEEQLPTRSGVYACATTRYEQWQKVWFNLDWKRWEGETLTMKVTHWFDVPPLPANDLKNGEPPK